MKKCRMCGKQFDVLYPDMWAYRRGDTRKWTFFCSWGCMRKYDREGEKGSMGRPRKDGTPARKPERKPKVDLTAESEELAKTDKPDEEKIVLVYDPGIAEEYRREHPEEYERMREEKDIVCRMEMETLEVCGVRSRVKKDCRYERVEQPDGRLCEMSLSNGGMWMQFTADEWRKFAAEIMLALQQLGL